MPTATSTDTDQEMHSGGNADNRDDIERAMKNEWLGHVENHRHDRDEGDEP